MAYLFTFLPLGSFILLPPPFCFLLSTPHPAFMIFGLVWLWLCSPLTLTQAPCMGTGTKLCTGAWVTHRPPYLRHGFILNPEPIDLNGLASQRPRGPGDQLVFHVALRFLIPPIIWTFLCDPVDLTLVSHACVTITYPPRSASSPANHDTS